MGTHSDGKKVTIGGFKGGYFDNREKKPNEIEVELKVRYETLENGQVIRIVEEA